jgi:hypothetical protein
MEECVKEIRKVIKEKLNARNFLTIKTNGEWVLTQFPGETSKDAQKILRESVGGPLEKVNLRDFVHALKAKRDLTAYVNMDGGLWSNMIAMEFVDPTSFFTQGAIYGPLIITASTERGLKSVASDE